MTWVFIYLLIGAILVLSGEYFLETQENYKWADVFKLSSMCILWPAFLLTFVVLVIIGALIAIAEDKHILFTIKRKSK